MNIDRFLLPLRKLLEDGVPFVVVGGLAVVLHGHLRLTMDLDLAISLEDDDITKLIKSLVELGYQPRLPISLDDFCNQEIREDWIKNKNMKALNLWRPPDPFSSLDLMIDIPVPFKSLLAESASMLVEDTQIKVASINHLIAMKKIAGRDNDKADILALQRIVEIQNDEK